MAERWIHVADLRDVPAGEVRGYRAGEEWIALCNLAGVIHAIEDVCPHDTGPLADGWIEGHEIVCPRHGARFDVRSGKVTCLPATEGIRSYPVRIEGGRILVRLDG